jgi:hypothetical protein
LEQALAGSLTEDTKEKEKEDEEEKEEETKEGPSVPPAGSREEPPAARRHWVGNESVINIANCEEYGMNDYVYEKYGGMMGIDSWFGDGY